MTQENQALVHGLKLRVQQDLLVKGMGKDGYNSHQKFNFRGIDQIYGVISPLLIKHGLSLTSNVVSHEVIPKTKGNEVFIMVEYTLTSVEDGSSVTSQCIGQAADFSDKAAAKALSMAMKYWCVQTFVIPFEGQPDADLFYPIEPDYDIDDLISSIEKCETMECLQENFGAAYKTVMESDKDTEALDKLTHVKDTMKAELSE